MIDKYESDFYLAYGLHEGEMTKVTAGVRALAEQIGGEDEVFLANAVNYLRHYFRLPKNKPDRMLRTADEILVAPVTEAQLLEGLPDKIRPIGTCTEWGKALRALCLARGIPAIWVEAVSDDWINVVGWTNDPTAYDDHVFLDVMLREGWMTLHTTGHPESRDSWIWKREDQPKYVIRGGADGQPKVYHPVAWGLDHTKLWSDDRRELSFHTKREWHIWVNHKFPRRIKKLQRLPDDY